jgi:hypothetical protein
VKKNQANSYSSGLQDLSSVKFKPPTSTVAGLPSAAANTNVLYEVTDGVTNTDCTMGLGTTLALCASNGAVWASLGGSTTGCSAAGGSGVVQKSNGSGGCVASSATDNATTFSVAEPVIVNTTSYMTPASGSTGQRPGSPSTAMVRYNTTQSWWEGYGGNQGNNWGPLNGAYVLSSTGTGSATTNAAGVNNLVNIKVPGNILGANGCVQLWVVYVWVNGGSPDVKVIDVRVTTASGSTTGGLQLFQNLSVSSANLTQYGMYRFCNAGATNSQVGAYSGSLGPNANAAPTSTLDTTSDVWINLGSGVNNAGDSAQIANYSAMVFPHQ